ncbi:MAG: Gfo/Idh/MocA family oxidoreductase [Nitrospira sp.]|nr:Gfo/Idh/MocA family oxidoreductase [Nitrospira sp.]
MAASIGVGLIGLGRHGTRYAKHLLEPLPEARLVAVCRRDAAKGRAFAADHGLRFHQDYQGLIADQAVQAVVVVTPPSLTKAVCLTAVRAGKPLLIEKPLAASASDARVMVEAADKAGVPLMTAQTLRFDAAVQALKKESAKVEPRRYLVLTNRVDPRPEVFQNPADYGGRGVLLEIGIHHLDLVRFLTGDEVREVSCDLWREAPGKPESRALVRLQTVGGLSGLIDVSRVSEGRVGRAEWVGGKGQIVADWYGHRLSLVRSRTEVDEWTVEDRPTLVEVLQRFLQALAGNGPMPVTGLDGLRAVEIAEACYRSAEEGRAVQL